MARKPAFISHGPEREANIQSRMLDALEARFRRQISAVLTSEATGLLSAYRNLGYVPAPTDDHVRDIREVYREIALASARTFGRRIMTQGKAAGLAFETKQTTDLSEFFRALANTWINLEPIRRRIQSVSETTRAQIVTIVARGQQDGLGVEAIARQIADRVPEINRWRGALIARTETHGAANYAMHETAKTTNLNLEKEWVSVEDMRTRSIARDDAFDHASMNGQRRPMDEPFDMPWIAGPSIPIMYPGQAGLPGGATINCRCAVVHRVTGGLLGQPVQALPRTQAPTVVGLEQDEPDLMLQSILRNQPVFRQNYDQSFDKAPALALRAIEKSQDLRGMIKGKKGAYANFNNEISMGSHVIGTQAYKNVFRHEYGHILDDQMAKANPSRADNQKIFQSWDAVRDLAADTRELELARSGLFMGDKGGSPSLDKRILASQAEHSEMRVEIRRTAREDGILDDPRAIIRQNIPEVEPDDVLRLFGLSNDLDRSTAIEIASAWRRRDVYRLLQQIPSEAGQRVSHSSALAGLQDTFEAGTGGNIRIMFGHGKQYYSKTMSDQRRRGMTSTINSRQYNGYATAQAFANWFEAYGSDNPAAASLYRNLWPRTHSAFERMLRDYIGSNVNG